MNLTKVDQNVMIISIIKKFVPSDLDIMNLIINNYNLRYKSDLGYKEFLVIKNIFSGPVEFVITRFDCNCYVDAFIWKRVELTRITLNSVS